MWAVKKRTQLIIALGIGVGALAAAGISTFLLLKSKRESVESKEYIKIELEHDSKEESKLEEIENELCTSKNIKTVFSFDEAYNIALDTAKEQFGENGFIVPASEKKAIYVNISGMKRACYMFGADKMDLINGSMKGLYHVDADTGEVFDNGSGDMKQIRFKS